MDVRIDDFSNSSCQEIPDDNTSVVAANGEQRATLVEDARDCHTDTVEGAIEVLNA